MKRLSVIGGDKRISQLINIVEKNGIEVCSYAIDEGSVKAYSLKDIFDFSETILLPLPVFSEKGVINAPQSRGKIAAEDILSLICPNNHIIGGKFDKEFLSEIVSRKARVTDIMDREDFAILNAIPTAEGALAVAIDNSDITLHGSDILIIGFGRIGKAMARILSNMGANIFAAARNDRDLAYASLFGAKPIRMGNRDFEETLKHCDFIFNTVPAMVLDSINLAFVKENALIIDLASVPGGVDKSAAAILEKRLIHALSLPVKYSPVTAAKILTDTVLNAAELK